MFSRNYIRQANKRDTLLTMLGVLYLMYWSLDFVNNALFTHDFSWILWYSAAGLLITGIALIIQNVRLIYSLFCALFVIEVLWTIDLFYAILSQNTLLGLTEQVLSSSIHTKNIFFTLYHVLIPLGLLIAVIRMNDTYKYAWIGATIFATMISLLTYFLTGPESQVNCVHSTYRCPDIFSFLYNLENPYKIITALIGLTIVVFIPSNYMLLYFKNLRIKNARRLDNVKIQLMR